MKAETLEAIIKKQDELIEHWVSQPVMGMKLTPKISAWIDKREQLEQELTTLKEGEQGMKKEDLPDYLDYGK